MMRAWMMAGAVAAWAGGACLAAAETVVAPSASPEPDPVVTLPATTAELYLSTIQDRRAPAASFSDLRRSETYEDPEEIEFLPSREIHLPRTVQTRQRADQGSQGQVAQAGLLTTPTTIVLGMSLLTLVAGLRLTRRRL